MAWRTAFFVLILSLALGGQTRNLPDNQPFPAYRVIGNIYYVGASDITSYLITTPAGHILLNSGYEETVPIIRQGVEKLGFRLEDIRILLNGQAHFDHVAGQAELKRLTGAKVYVSEEDAPLIESGGKGDFLFGDKYTFPPCKVDRRLRDLETVTLGGVTLTAHLTPGHTRGCTTWTMRVDDGGRSYDVVFVGGTSINPGTVLLGNPKYPGIADDFARTFRVLHALKCDVFLGAHGGYYGMNAKYQRLMKGESPNPFIDPEGYAKHVEVTQRRYRDQLAREGQAKTGTAR